VVFLKECFREAALCQVGHGRPGQFPGIVLRRGV
jgi:hypothetical protein